MLCVLNAACTVLQELRWRNKDARRRVQTSDGAKPSGTALAFQVPCQQTRGQETLQHTILCLGVRPASYSHLQPLLCAAKPFQEESDTQDWWSGHCLLGHTDKD